MKKMVVLATVLIVAGVILSSIGTMYEFFPGIPRHTSIGGLFLFLFGTTLAGAYYEHKKEMREKDDFEHLS